MGLAKPVSPVLQRGHPLARGLVGAWPFSEGSGLFAQDLAGQNLGLIRGAPFVAGPFGYALSFNGTSDHIDTGALSPICSGSTDMTLCAWIKRTTTGGNTDQIIANDRNFGTRQFNFTVGGTGFHPGNLLFETFGGGGTLVVSNATLNNNQWYFVAVAFNNAAQVAKLFINGVQDTSVSCTGFSSSTNQITIGVRLYAGFEDYFHGHIDGPLIYNRALSNAEMAQLYFDSFAIYRARSRWWEVLVSGGASSVTVLKASLTLTPKITSGSTSPAVSKGSLTLTPKLVTGTVSSAVLKGLLTLTPKLVSIAGSVFTITKAALALTPKLVTGDLSASAITHSTLTLTPKLVPSAPVSAIIVRGSLVLGPRAVSSPSILAGLAPKKDLTVVPYHYSHMPPPTDASSLSSYFMREIRRLQTTITDLHKAANQATDEAPLVPLNGMIRYAKGAWASALGGEGLYVYKAGVWTRIV